MIRKFNPNLGREGGGWSVINTRLLFTDTDSLCYKLHEKNKESIQENIQVQRTI